MSLHALSMQMKQADPGRYPRLPTGFVPENWMTRLAPGAPGTL